MPLCLSSSLQSTVCTKSHSMLVVVGMEQLPLAVAVVVEVVGVLVAAVVAVVVAAAKTVVDAVATTLVHPSTWTVLV